MNRRTTRWARLAVVSCAVAVVGCDNSETAYLDQQANALAVRAAGGSGTEVGNALTTATEGNLPVNIQANQLLAQARLSDARELSAALRLKQSEAEAIVTRIGALASTANVAQTYSNSYRQMEPTASTALMKDLSAKVRGDGNVQYFSDLPNGTIPTLSAVQQERSRLEGEITKAQSDLQSATTQRDQLLTQAGQLARQADQQRGQERLDSVTKAADLRQQAAVVSRTISELEAKLAQFNAELAIQQRLEADLQTALKSFEAQQASLSSGWNQTKERVDQQSQLATAILKAESTQDGQESVASLAGVLNKRISELNDQREQALAAYNEASSKFSAAETAANTYSSTISDSGKPSAEAAARKSLANTLHADRFNVQKAVAMHEQASVHLSHARFLVHMASVATQLEALPENLKANIPEPFSSEKLNAQAAEEVKNADELLTQAKDQIEGVAAADESLAGLRPLKHSTAIFVNYDRALLSKLAANAKLPVDAAKEEVYKDSIESAKAAVTAAREASIAVPSVPEAIYVAPPKPTEEASTEGATTPAEDSPAVAELKQSLRDAATQMSGPQATAESVETLFARIKADETSQPFVTSLREMADLQVRVQGAVRAKWGDEGVAQLQQLNSEADAAQPMSPEQINQRIDQLKFKAVDETHVELPLPFPGENPPSVKFVKEEDVWKLDLTQLPEGAGVILNAASGVMGGMKDKLNQLATDIEGGKYNSVDEVKAAIKEMMPAMPGQPGATPAGETPAGAEATPATEAPASTDTPAPTPAEETPAEGGAPATQTPPNTDPGANPPFNVKAPAANP